MRIHYYADDSCGEANHDTDSLTSDPNEVNCSACLYMMHRDGTIPATTRDN